MVIAENFDPGVSPTWDALPSGVKTFLTDVAGTIMNIGLIAAVIVLIAGVIVWGGASLSNRPGVAAIGVKVVAVSGLVAILCAGSNALITFFANQAPSIFS